MNSEMLDVAHRRSAIASGLKPFVSSAMLENALNLWEQRYSAEPLYALNHFLNEICDTDELRRSRKEILKTLLRALTDLEQSSW